MLDYIKSCITIIFAVSVMYIFLDCSFKNKRYLFLLGLFEAVVLIGDILVIKNYGYAYFLKLYPILVHIPVFLAFVYLSKFNAIKVFFVQSTVVAITTSFTLLGVIISYFFGSNRLYVNIACYIMYVPVGFFIYKHLRPSFLYMLRNADKGWIGFCTIPLSFSVLIFLVSKYSISAVTFDTSAFVNSLLILILTFTAYVQIFRFFRQSREQLIMQSEQDLLKTQVAAAHIHLDALKDSQEKTIIYRHDMRHHLALISANLRNNNTEAALKYITAVEENIEGTAVEKYCINNTVNLILYYYILMAKNEDISVETHIDLAPQINISDMDLCVIFANAIENAINASKHISDKNARTLKIICKTKNDQLFIQFANSYEGSIEFNGDMPATARENHGLGTKSIAAVVKKYNGVYSFTAEDGVFRTSVIL